MRITKIVVRKIFKSGNEGRIAGIVSVTFDDQLVVHDIKIINGTERRFLAMPNRRSENGRYQDVVHPIDKTFRAVLEQAVFETFDKAAEEGEKNDDNGHK